MFLGLLPAPFVTWTIAASTVAAMFARPRRIPEAIWACLGAGLLLAFHLVPFPEALGAVTKPKYGDGIEWKLKQDVDFLRDA